MAVQPDPGEPVNSDALDWRSWPGRTSSGGPAAGVRRPDLDHRRRGRSRRGRTRRPPGRSPATRSTSPRWTLKGLQEIPNVGKSIADKILEYLATGQDRRDREAARQGPRGCAGADGDPGAGAEEGDGPAPASSASPRSTELEQAIEDGRLAGLRGFGPKTEENILHGIELLRARRRPGAHQRRR